MLSLPEKTHPGSVRADEKAILKPVGERAVVESTPSAAGQHGEMAERLKAVAC